MARPALLGSMILDVLKYHHLLSAHELIELLPADHGKKFNKTSVYRALEKLEAQDLVCQHVFETNEAQYELRQEQHDHLVCERCGVVQAAKVTVALPPVVDGFITHHYHLTVFGLCADCAAKAGS